MSASKRESRAPLQIRRSTIGLLVSTALIAASCTSEPDSAADVTTTEATTTTEAMTTVPEQAGEPTEAEVPALSGVDGAIGQASDLALDWFNGATFDAATFSASFDENFTSAITFDELSTIDQVRGDAPFSVREVANANDTQAQLIVVGSSGMPGTLSVSIVGPEDPTMTSFFIGPGEPATFSPPADTAEALERLAAMGTVRVGVFGTDCSPVSIATTVRGDEQAPIGSAFKLWVLEAVVDAVAAGTISWDDEIEMRVELDSYPSGVTQNDEPGTLLTVRTLAERMIEISDNTATNHLMFLLGRPAVEQAMIDSGHGDPGRNLPMMDAREFTIVKFGAADLRDRYVAADETERRQILEEEVAVLPLPPISAITSVSDPIEVESLEWFASPVDLCRSLTRLATDEVAADILSRSPGVPDEAGRWDAVLFKGGSEPGVIAMAWLVIDSAGEQFVIAGGVANDDALIDEFEAASLLAYLRDSVAG